MSNFHVQKSSVLDIYYWIFIFLITLIVYSLGYLKHRKELAFEFKTTVSLRNTKLVFPIFSPMTGDSDSIYKLEE